MARELRSVHSLTLVATSNLPRPSSQPRGPASGRNHPLRRNLHPLALVATSLAFVGTTTLRKKLGGGSDRGAEPLEIRRNVCLRVTWLAFGGERFDREVTAIAGFPHNAHDAL